MPSRTETPLYTSKIIKSSALVADTCALMAHWDETLDVEENLTRVKRENLLGKASRSRVEDMLAAFRRRYFSDPSVGRSICTLVKADLPTDVIAPLLYYQSAKDDRLLYDVVTQVLVSVRALGRNDISYAEMCAVLQRWMDEGKTQRPWGLTTLQRVASGILTTLRDFGVLEGTSLKRISSVYLPLESFAFIAFELHRETTGEPLLHHPDWGLFFLSTGAVERLFMKAHQEKLLEYYAAGSVIRVEFPAATLEEYAHDLAERQNRTS